MNPKEKSLPKLIELYRKYASLRHRRFFIFCKNGKGSTQLVGNNTLGKIPSIIANYLKLPDAKLYTGHCMRRTSATLLADGAADLTTVERLDGWKSGNVTEGYIEFSAQSKMLIAKQILTDNENNENNKNI